MGETMSTDDEARREENARKLAEMLAWDGEPEVYLQHLDDNVQYTAPYYDGFGVRASKAEVASMVGAVQEMFAKVKYDRSRLPHRRGTGPQRDQVDRPALRELLHHDGEVPRWEGRGVARVLQPAGDEQGPRRVATRTYDRAPL